MAVAAQGREGSLEEKLHVGKEVALTVGAIAAGVVATGVELVIAGPSLVLGAVSGLFLHHVTARWFPGVYRPAVEACVKDLRREVRELHEQVEHLGGEIRDIKRRLGSASSSVG